MSRLACIAAVCTTVLLAVSAGAFASGTGDPLHVAKRAMSLAKMADARSRAALKASSAPQESTGQAGPAGARGEAGPAGPAGPAGRDGAPSTATATSVGWAFDTTNAVITAAGTVVLDTGSSAPEHSGAVRVPSPGRLIIHANVQVKTNVAGAAQVTCRPMLTPFTGIGFEVDGPASTVSFPSSSASGDQDLVPIVYTDDYNSGSVNIGVKCTSPGAKVSVTSGSLDAVLIPS